MQPIRKTDRRHFLMEGAALSVGIVALPLAACKKGPDCKDVSGLTAAQIQTRQALKYVTLSNTPGKNCANCKLYTAETAKSCGGCTLFPGPVTKEGYCIGWQAK